MSKKYTREERKLRREERRAARTDKRNMDRKKRGFNMYSDIDYYNAFYGDDYVTDYTGYSRTYSRVANTSAPNNAENDVLTPEAQALVQQLLAKQARTYASYEDALKEENPVPDSYFPGATGWMVLQRRIIDGNEMQFVTKTAKNPLISTQPESSNIKIVNRIPKELLVEIVGSFARICKASGNEAAAQIYRERDGERKYIVYYPEQKISGAAVTYADDPGMITMRATYDLIMELHSHNTMAAFWSGTDNNNEKDCGFYMVIGTFGAASATYKCRYKYGLNYADFPAHNIFDMTPEEEVEILKRDNWTEGNPIIDEKAKCHAVTYGGARGSYAQTNSYNRGNYTYNYGVAYGRSSDDSRNSGKLPERLKTEYEKFKYSVISYATNYDLARSLWAYSKANAQNKWVCENHIYMNSPESGYAWVPITIAEGINPFLNDVKPYVEHFVKEWNEHKVLTTPAPASSTTTYGGYTSGSYSYNTSPAAVVDMLIGSSDDTQARQVSLPSKYKEYQNMNVPEYKPGINDDNFIAAVEMQAIARVTANENIEAAYETIVARDSGSTEPYVAMTENDFKERLLGRINGEFVESDFDATIMWELFTSVDKSRLARTFGLTVVELSGMFGKLEIPLCYPFVVFIYWSLMVNDVFRANLIKFLERQYKTLNIDITNFGNVNIIAELNSVFKHNPNVAIDVIRPKDANPYAADELPTQENMVAESVANEDQLDAPTDNNVDTTV